MAKKKSETKTNKASEKTSSRKLKQPSYKSFRLSKPIKHTGRSLPSGWKLLKQSWALLWKHKKVLGGVLAIYGIVQIILVQGVFTSNFSELKKTVDETVGGFGGGLTLFTYLVSSAGQTGSAEDSIYQSTLLVIGSLAFIWALRQLMADKQIKIRDAYYKGMYPLITFILVLLVIGIQTVPALIGAWLFGIVTGNGIAASSFELIFWAMIFFIFALLSFYMLCSSLFALYIVTLPDVTPMKALRSARGLVLHRRWSVARKILLLIFAVLVIGALIMLPVIMVVPVLVPVVFYLLTVIWVGFIHTYMYSLYRELLADD